MLHLPHRTVLILIDLQRAIDDPRWAKHGPRNNPGAEAAAAALLGRWRRLGWPIIHVRHDSTEPDSTYRPGTPGHLFKAEVAPVASETVIAKQVNSAFIGTDLDRHLRDISAPALVMLGVITNNSFEATVRNGGNLGHAVFVPEDACFTYAKLDLRGRVWAAEDVHALSLANLHGEYATVTSSTDILSAVPH
ncbi:isochorismatase family protein [Dongia deserti]|uniref:isochorismatase family protein n=1 Tax=Dongia deserti TaxID=2268030 RepID=UPI000E65465B|nr:isochorismatase family protein [Dongia deserti]